MAGDTLTPNRFSRSAMAISSAGEPVMNSGTEHLATVVRAARRAHGVRQLRLPTTLAVGQRQRRGLPVRPAAAGVAARRLALGDGHGHSLLFIVHHKSL